MEAAEPGESSHTWGSSWGHCLGDRDKRGAVGGIEGRGCLPEVMALLERQFCLMTRECRE